MSVIILHSCMCNKAMIIGLDENGYVAFGRISKIFDNGHLLEDLVVTSAHGP